MFKVFLFLCLSLAAFCVENASIRTIAVLKYGDELPVRCFRKGIWIDPCLDVPGKRWLFARTLYPFVQSPVTTDDLKWLEQTITYYYCQANRPIVSVVIPKQDLTCGILKVYILEPILENVCLSGNQWTSPDFILDISGLQIGQPINSYDLQTSIAWLNRSPFRQTDISMYPGCKPGTTQVDLITEERFPLRVYAGADNTGTVFLDHTRIYAGFNAGNLWGLDHLASFQWTTAPNPHILTAFSAQYVAPLAYFHQLQFYGGYSKFKGDLPVNLMSQKGEAWQVSARYQIPINPIFGSLLQQFSFGYDFKRANSELLFGGVPFQGKFADINQFYFGYVLDYITCSTKTSLVAELIAAPIHFTHDQNNDNYETLRPFAKAKYAYGRLRVSNKSKFGWGFSTRTMMAGQWTRWNLLASEQFPLGGYETVRGYEERAFNADSGFLASFELATPNFGFFCKDLLEFLGFIDYGWGRLHKPFFGQKKTEWLLGVGPGIRYHYRPYLVIRGDVGFPLHKAGVGRYGVHYYASATVSY